MLIYSLTCSSIGCLAYAVYPSVSRLWLKLAGRVGEYQELKILKTAKLLDDLYLDVKPAWLNIAYRVTPLVTALIAFLILNNVIVAVIGAVAGMLLPDFIVKQAKAQRKRKFQNQLVDSLFMLSSSLRAGLSLTQAFETLESEMPPPASQEFGLMMKAHRVGRSLEEALQGLNQRMACEELNLITTAVLVARGTGGDITRIIGQLINTIREKKKLNDKISTLTMQGKLQAYIMSALPVFFAISVRGFNENYFEIFFTDPLGRSLVALIVVLWIVGMILMFKLSKVDI